MTIAADRVSVCPFCGHFYPAGFGFCSWCMENIPDEEPSSGECPRCGCEADAGCPACEGTGLNPLLLGGPESAADRLEAAARNLIRLQDMDYHDSGVSKEYVEAWKVLKAAVAEYDAARNQRA